MKIILGSQSQSRRKLFAQLVPTFETLSADINEKAIRSDNYELLPLLLAHAKADALLPKIARDALLITSDQVVICNGELREKPESTEQAREYLRSYATHPAQTNTAIVVTNTATRRRCEGMDIARAYFGQIPEDVIDRLIEQGDVMHTAGGFLIEDPIIKPYVERIEGTSDSIMGLPLELTRRLMEQAVQTDRVS